MSQIPSGMTQDALTLVQAMATSVLVLDAKATILWCNEAAQSLCGMSARTLCGVNAGLFLEALPDWIARLVRLSEKGAPVSSFAEFKKTPEEKGVSVLAVLSAMSGDRFLLEILEAEQSIAMQKAEQSAGMSDASRALLRNLAHEIKNPLGGIRGAAQLLEAELPDTALCEYTQVIVGEVDRLQALVDRLLAPYRRDREETPLNLHEVLEHVRHLMVAEYPTGLSIERDYDVSVPDLKGNREELIQVFVNLMRNAAEALVERIQAGDAKIILRTRVARGALIQGERVRTALCAEVIDNGPGIDSAIRDKLFYPLVTTRSQGTGLGLSLVQTFVERHRGAIEVESESGRTAFRILFALGGTKRSKEAHP